MGKINIQITRETHHKLQDLGKKGESYNDIVEKLIQYYLDHH